MEERTFMTVDEVAQFLKVSKAKAYKIVQKLNEELEAQGFYVIRGRINTGYLMKKVCYSE